MTMKRLIEQEGGTSRIFHFDHSTGESTLQLRQDVEPIFESNKRMLSESSKDWKKDMHHVARIPTVIIAEWSKELGDNCLKGEHRPWFMAKINNSDYSKLRVKAGKV